MGKRGPAPQPTALRELHGNPGKRAKPKNEPKPEPTGAVPSPPYLGKDAAAVWREGIEQLRVMGLLTKADLNAFASFCSAMGDFIQANRALKRGIVVKGSDGVHRRSPWFLVKAKAFEQIKQLAPQFGMTPSGRAALGRAATNQPDASLDHPSPVPTQGDGFDDFLASKPSAATVN